MKSLSGQTRKATEEIGGLIQQLQSAVSELTGSVEAARSHVASAQALSDATGQDIASINDQVALAAGRMAEIASTLQEQSQATGELSRNVSNIAEGCRTAAGRADQVIDTVKQSEALIEQRFGGLEGREIPDYVLFRAKSDHLLWKKRLSEMLVGLNNLTESELADHHSCRLGKWYGGVDDASIRGHRAYGELETPHAAVHANGKRAAALFAQGDRDGAYAAIADMEAASVDVVRLLDELLAR